MPTITDTMTAQINEQLDKLEANLPTVPARVVRLQRAVATKTYERTVDFWSAVSESTRNFFETTRLSGRTVVGQAKAAGDQVATATRTGAPTVTGQARAAGTQVAGTTRTAANTVAGQTTAQGRKVAKSATGEATKLLDGAIDTIEDAVEDAEQAVGSHRPHQPSLRGPHQGRAARAGPGARHRGPLADEQAAAHRRPAQGLLNRSPRSLRSSPPDDGGSGVRTGPAVGASGAG